MFVVFDLDGTLADTRELVRRSYELVGVDMPEGAWGRPAASWLPEIAGLEWHVVHREKNVVMRTLQATEGVRRLPCAALACQLHYSSRYRVSILTGASAVSARGTRHAVRLNHVPFMLVGATLEDKLVVLNHYPPGIYFDDDHEACLCVAELTSWQVVYVSEDSTHAGVLSAFEEAEELCTESFSLEA